MGAEPGSALWERFTAGRMPLGAAVAMLDELARFVGEGHRRGVTHGALQPGVVWWDGSRMRVTAAAAPDPAYLSPQQLKGKPADPRTVLPKLTDRVARTLLIAVQRSLTERFADVLTMRAALRGDSQAALDTPTLKWAVKEGVPEGEVTDGIAEFLADEPVAGEAGEGEM